MGGNELHNDISDYNLVNMLQNFQLLYSYEIIDYILCGLNCHHLGTESALLNKLKSTNITAV